MLHGCSFARNPALLRLRVEIGVSLLLCRAHRWLEIHSERGGSARGEEARDVCRPYLAALIVLRSPFLTVPDLTLAL